MERRAAYLVYLAQVVLRVRRGGDHVQWRTTEIGLAVAGVAVLAGSAFFIVRATETIASAVGIPEIIAGLFVTAPMAAVPELFATWNVTRSGQVTTATTSVIGDHVVTMSIAFLPLALVGLPVENVHLYWVNCSLLRWCQRRTRH